MAFPLYYEENLINQWNLQPHRLKEEANKEGFKREPGQNLLAQTHMQGY